MTCFNCDPIATLVETYIAIDLMLLYIAPRELTSKNPFMKLSGNRSAPRKFSVLKYDMTCVLCFQ